MSVSLRYMWYLPGHDQLGDIKHYLSTLDRYNVTELGQALGLRYTTLRDLPHGGFLNEVMTLWLDEADDVLKKGKPSWRSLIRGLRNELVRQNGIANKIAADHRTQGMFALYCSIYVCTCMVLDVHKVCWAYCGMYGPRPVSYVCSVLLLLQEVIMYS